MGAAPNSKPPPHICHPERSEGPAFVAASPACGQHMIAARQFLTTREAARELREEKSLTVRVITSFLSCQLRARSCLFDPPGMPILVSIGLPP